MMQFKVLSYPLMGFYSLPLQFCTESRLCFAVLNMCFAEGQLLKVITAVKASDIKVSNLINTKERASK